jgi:predicted RNase H-like HicB family nuclease
MQLTAQVEREADSRWIAAVDPIGALAYGRTRAEAVRKAKAVALEVLADRLAHGESPLTGRKTRRRTEGYGRAADRVRRLIGSLDSGEPELAEKHQVKILESLRRRPKTSA